MASSTYSYIMSLFRNSRSLSLEILDVERVRLLLHTLEKSELHMLKTELENNGWQYSSFKDREFLISHIEKMTMPPKRQPQRNETIGELLKQFCNKNSKMVQVARIKLRRRYGHQTTAVQRKIIDAFLDGAKGDRHWAFGRLMRGWDKCFESKIDALWHTHHEELCRCIIVRYFSEEYLMKHEDVWKSRAADERCEEVDACSNCEYMMQLEEVGEDYGLYADFKAYKHICMRLVNTPGFVVDRNRLFEGDYYEVMAMTGGHVNGAEMLDYIFRLVAKQLESPETIFVFTYPGCDDSWGRGSKDYSVATVCDLEHLLYYMALLKLDKELIHFFNWDRSVGERFSWYVDGYRFAYKKVHDIYVNVLKESLPDPKMEFSDTLQEYDEQNNTTISSALSPEEKAEKLETLCKKNPNLASMIEKLNLE